MTRPLTSLIDLHNLQTVVLLAVMVGISRAADIPAIVAGARQIPVLVDHHTSCRHHRVIDHYIDSRERDCSS